MTLVLLVLLLATLALMAADAPLDVGSQRQLFIDRRFIAASEGLSLVMEKPTKAGVVLRADRPWEAAQLGAYSTIIHEHGQFRLWYDCIASLHPREVRYVAYATSSDGVSWEKKPLGSFEFAGSRVNNVLFEMTEGAVFVDPHGPPEQRYKYLGMLPGKGLGVNTSPDGLHWQLAASPVFPFTCDTQNMAFWDDRIGRYVAYLRNWTPLRAVSRVEMDDIMAPWPYRRDLPPNRAWGDHVPPPLGEEVPVVFHYDEQDPPDSDHYTPCVVKYPWAADAYFMFPAAYQHYPPPPQGRYGNDGPLEIQMAASRDGVSWSRVDRSAFIPLGQPGSGEEGCLYAFPSLVRVGDELWLYYTAYPLTHGAPYEPYSGTMRRVVLRLDGFVAAAFAWTGGSLVTPPLRFSGDRLELNLDTGALGRAQVELVGPDDQPLPGYTLADCDPIVGNYVHRLVTWHGEPAIKAASPLRLRLVARNTRLYAFQFLAGGQ